MTIKDAQSLRGRELALARPLEHNVMSLTIIDPQLGIRAIEVKPKDLAEELNKFEGFTVTYTPPEPMWGEGFYIDKRIPLGGPVYFVNEEGRWFSVTNGYRILTHRPIPVEHVKRLRAEE